MIVGISQARGFSESASTRRKSLPRPTELKAALACLGGAQKLGSFFDALGEHTVKGVTAIQPRSTPGIPVNCLDSRISRCLYTYASGATSFPKGRTPVMPVLPLSTLCPRVAVDEIYFVKFSQGLDLSYRTPSIVNRCSTLKPVGVAGPKLGPTCPVATPRWTNVTRELYTNARPAPWKSVEPFRSRTRAIWNDSLPSAGTIFKRHVAVAASPQSIEVIPSGGAEGVQVVLFGWLGARDKYLVDQQTALTHD
eukprot:1192692-Prorocentrum_minimum.AAC.1